MKRIEAVISHAALDGFRECARRLGIFGFDLSEEPQLRDQQRRPIGNTPTPDPVSRLKVDFAVLDGDTKPTVHAVLESVHPESIAIFKFDENARPETATRRLPIHP